MNRSKKHLTRKRARIIVGLLMTSIGAGTTLNFWRHVTHNFTDFDFSKPTDVSLPVPPENDYLVARTEDVKTRFIDVIANKLHQDDRDWLSANEQTVVKDTLKDYEFLEDIRKDNGLYAAAFRKKDTGEIIVTYGGTSTISVGRVLANVDDMFISTAGGEVSQLDDALKFTKLIHEKYGKIDYVTGYSIGAYLALYAVGTGACGEAQCYGFDSPGATRAMLHNCSELCGQPESEVVSRLRRNVTSTTISLNTYNTIGEQPGEHLTFSNALCNWSIIPKNHRYPEFLKGVATGSHLMPGEDQRSSNGPWVCSTALSALAATGVLLAAKKDKGNAFDRGIRLDPLRIIKSGPSMER